MGKELCSIECLEKKECCGCGACFNKCPVNAIKMEYDEDGFLAPVVYKEKCVKCGICKEVCPSIHVQYTNSDNPKVYAAMASDKLRETCSSGGIFTVLAENVLDKGGYVCGAVLNSEYDVEHIVANSREELERIKESKYIPSDTKLVYKEIEGLLLKGETVIFGGCPCQAAGLRGYLKKDYEKLYIVDILCTGGISHSVWEKYLHDFHKGKEIKSLKFRDKKTYGWVHGMHIEFKDGKIYNGPKALDPFYKAFMKKVAFREFCNDCKFANKNRQGDLTLGDFWGVRQYDAKLDDRKGTSIVTINNEKGEKLFKEIKDNLYKAEEVPLDFLMRRGQPFQAPKKANPARNRYMELIKKYPLEKALKYALEGRYDVGIVGVWWGSNYGSLMTYYSLYKMISSYGLSTIMIDRPGFKPDNELFTTHARKFAKSHFEAISELYSFEELWKLNNICDAFVVGSDQVWNFGISAPYQRNFFLDFADDSKKKISYAASFGHDFFKAPRDEVQAHTEIMKRLDAISVREDSGVKIVNHTFHLNATRVLDPVFMVDTSVYDSLAEESEKKVEEPFIVAYILDPSPEKREAILYVAEKKGLKLINILDGFRNKLEQNKEKMQLEVDEDVEVQDWLYYIKNCKYLITDSCHGASFAIIYEKPFVCIGNKARGLTRFESLFNLLKLRERMILEPKEILQRPDLLDDINYVSVKKILKRERERSRLWFEEAMFSRKIGDTKTAFPFVDSRVETRKVDEYKEQKWKEYLKNIAKRGKRKIGKIYRNYLKKK